MIHNHDQGVGQREWGDVTAVYERRILNRGKGGTGNVSEVIKPQWINARRPMLVRESGSVTEVSSLQLKKSWGRFLWSLKARRCCEHRLCLCRVHRWQSYPRVSTENICFWNSMSPSCESPSFTVNVSTGYENPEATGSEYLSVTVTQTPIKKIQCNKVHVQNKIILSWNRSRKRMCTNSVWIHYPKSNTRTHQIQWWTNPSNN